MHESEAERFGLCAECNSEVSTAERVYTFGPEEVLCYECALRRGGVYDELHDRWVVSPQVADLLERSRRDL